MKLFRYRRSSWKPILGMTSAKKWIKKSLGITAALKPFCVFGNQKRRIKRAVGYGSGQQHCEESSSRLIALLQIVTSLAPEVWWAQAYCC